MALDLYQPNTLAQPYKPSQSNDVSVDSESRVVRAPRRSRARRSQALGAELEAQVKATRGNVRVALSVLSASNRDDWFEVALRVDRTPRHHDGTQR